MKLSIGKIIATAGLCVAVLSSGAAFAASHDSHHMSSRMAHHMAAKHHMSSRMAHHHMAAKHHMSRMHHRMNSRMSSMHHRMSGHMSAMHHRM